VQRTYDIDNGGNGVNMPSSLLDIGRGVYLDGSAGGDPSLADDGIVADVINFNGAGGSAPIMNVPVTANEFKSNRHGARFFREITVSNIWANSSHQDKWEINASPTGPITFVQLDENRGSDGGSIDWYFQFNADTTVTTLEHVWSSLRVGAGSTLSVGLYDYTDWTTAGTDPNTNLNPVVLDGNMTASTFTMNDVNQGVGTWGRIGSGADTEVEWITGDGLLTVPIPEPSTLVLAVVGTLCLARGLRRRG
jgi:hypothetical protein